ncbi:MAG TPA: biotin-dependent carboxyltransferase family protein, partial [Glaciihabitans sp.]|nr:biotin-dependent carboxyltransferase family protein [Glaciihabitans sp.]
MKSLRILSPGPLTLVEDSGRRGLSHLGVGPSGAMDRAAHHLANRLVGNPVEAASLEILVGGFSAQIERATWFAITGAWGALRLDGHPVEPHTATLAGAGSTLTIGQATAGLRFYLAVRGGIAVEPVLGSRSRDTLAGLGPAPLAEGDEIPIGAEPPTQIPAVDNVPVGPPENDALLPLRPGPRTDWFDPESWHTLFDTRWRVSP